MTEVDASIPLQSRNPFDTGQMLSLANLAQQMRQRQTQIQSQNALSQLLANPQSYDPKGSLTQSAQQNANALSPEFGLKYRQQQIDAHFDQIKEKSLTDEMMQRKLELSGSIADASEKAREDALKSGKSEQESIEAAAAARKSGFEAAGGLFSNEEVQKAISTPYDKVIAGSLKRFKPGEIQEERLAEQDKLGMARLGLQERQEAGREKAESDRFAALMRGITDKEKGIGNPKVAAFDAFMREHPNATAEEQARFIQTTGQAPRSPTAMAMQKYIQEHPDASAEDLEKFNADIRSTAKASADFSTGKQGQIINSMNVSTSHLQTLDSLADALHNKDERTFNKLALAWKKETGNPAPTNFEAAKTIVGDEVVKAIVGAGGGVSDREKAQAAINAANTPAQLHGAINTVYKLMGGQLKGLKLQYEQTTKKKDFLDRLSPEAKRALLGDEEKSTDNAPKVGDKFKHASGATVEIIG